MIIRHRKCIGTVSYIGGFLSPPDPFVVSMTEMMIYCQEALCKDGEFVQHNRSQYGLIDWARNTCVREMMGDWLLFVDADHVFDPDLCARLVMRMYAHDLDCVVGLYPFKHSADRPVLYMHNHLIDKHEVVQKWDRSLDMFQVDSAGGGCLLTRRRVFERIVTEIKQDPFARIGELGEDHSFFKRLRMLNIKAYCAWKVQCGHLKFHPVEFDEMKADENAEMLALNDFNVKGFPASPSLSADSIGLNQ